MNKRLKKEIDQNVAEKHGWKWAATRFINENWSATKEEARGKEGLEVLLKPNDYDERSGISLSECDFSLWRGIESSKLGLQVNLMFTKFKEEKENEKNFMCNYVGNIVS
jgi:hypothetical protein